MSCKGGSVSSLPKDEPWRASNIKAIPKIYALSRLVVSQTLPSFYSSNTLFFSFFLIYVAVQLCNFAAPESFRSKWVRHWTCSGICRIEMHCFGSSCTRQITFPLRDRTHWMKQLYESKIYFVILSTLRVVRGRFIEFRVYNRNHSYYKLLCKRLIKGKIV